VDDSIEEIIMAVKTMESYRAQVSQELAAQHEREIEDAATQRMLADQKAEQKEAARLAILREAQSRLGLYGAGALAIEHGLPPDASPRAVSDAMALRESEFWSGFLSSGGMMAVRKYRALAAEVGCDPDTCERRDVWAAMRAQGHPLIKATRDPATGALRLPAAA
jgi:hypothetical protein